MNDLCTCKGKGVHDVCGVNEGVWKGTCTSFCIVVCHTMLKSCNGDVLSRINQCYELNAENWNKT